MTSSRMILPVLFMGLLMSGCFLSGPEDGKKAGDDPAKAKAPAVLSTAATVDAEPDAGDVEEEVEGEAPVETPSAPERTAAPVSSWHMVISDDFNRSETGDDWIDGPTFDDTSYFVIDENMLRPVKPDRHVPCMQYDALLTKTSFRISVRIIPAVDNFSGNAWVGFITPAGEWCCGFDRNSPLLVSSPSGESQTTGDITLSRDTVYVLTLVIDGGRVSASLTGGSTDETVTIGDKTSPGTGRVLLSGDPGIRFDDLLVESTDTTTPATNVVFFDDFNRADTLNGSAGSLLWSVWGTGNSLVQVKDNKLRMARGRENPRPVSAIMTRSTLTINPPMKVSLSYMNEAVTFGFSDDDFLNGFQAGIWGHDGKAVARLCCRVDGGATIYLKESSDFISEPGREYRAEMEILVPKLNFRIIDSDGNVRLDISGELPSDFRFHDLKFFICGGQNGGFGDYVYIDDVVIEEIDEE